MTRCSIPEFSERCKIDIGMNDDESKKILPRTVKRKDKCVYNHKNHYCVIWEKNKKDALLNGVEEIDRNFKNVENKINENKLQQRIRYNFPKHETIDQLEIAFVFDLETHSDQEFAEAYAAGLYDVNRLRDRWDKYLTTDEIVIEKENVTPF